ncbi:4Fe-4S dicluster domain-containing protein [bacterium]|nr:4Fe-4S dicluster domain-containing protein [bacterium]
MNESDFIDIEELESDFADEVASLPGGEKIRLCFSCGTCTAGCPVRLVDEKFNPRRIIRMVLLGMREEVLKSDFIWICSSCFTCSERCPQGVKIADIMMCLKNLAAKAGYIPQSFLMQLDLIANQGMLYKIDDFDNKKREKLGLPHLPKRIEEISKLLEAIVHSLKGEKD